MASPTRKTNWFAIILSVVVVVAVVAVGGVVVWLNNQATAPAEAPAAGAIDQDTGGITIGDGADVLETYVDFMCPYCGQFEEGWGDTISDEVASGALTLTVYPVAILDAQSQGTEYSTRAANALYCVTEESADAAYPFLRELYDNQPEEGTTGLTDDELVSYAERVDAGGAASCIEDRTYADFVAQVTDALPADPTTGSRGTPTVLLNGETVNWQGDVQTELVDKLQG